VGDRKSGLGAGRDRSLGRLGRASWVRLAGLVVVVLLGCVSWAQARPGGTAVQGPDSSSSGSMDAAQQRAAADEAERKSPEAADRRRRSRSEHKNLNASDSLSTDQQSQPALVARPLGAVLKMKPGEKLVRYQGKYAAVVDINGKRAVIDSTVPLQAPDESGNMAPVNLDLQHSGSGFSVARPIVPVHVSDKPDGAVSVGSGGLQVWPLQGAHPVPGQLVDGRVFWANAQQDTDVLAMPTPAGVEVSYLLRSPDSPQDITLGLGLPAGAQASRTFDQAGGIKIKRNGKVVATITPPVARDAGGKEVNVAYAIGASGDLVMRVDHRSKDLEYPIAVDPEVSTDQLFDYGATPVGWNANNVNGNWNYATWDVGAGSPGLSIYRSANWPGDGYGQRGDFYHTAPGNSYISQVSLFGMRWWLSDSCIHSFVQRYAGGTYPDLGDYQDCRAGGTQTSNFYGVGPIYIADRTPDKYYLVLSMYTAYQGGQRGFTMGHWTGTQMVYGDQAAPVNTRGSFPSGWINPGQSDPGFTLAADDAGVGTQRIDYTVDGGANTTYTRDPCTGAWNYYCNTDGMGPSPPNYKPNGTYTTPSQPLASLPEGDLPVQANATDVVGNPTSNPSAPSQWPTLGHVKIDKTPPTVDLSGTLDEARDKPRLTTDSPTLNVTTTDENDNPNVATSGVRNIEVKFDGVDNTPATNYVEQQCPGGGCTLQNDFQLNTSSLANGSHTVDVIVTDFANNVTDQTWDFTIDRTSPEPSCSDPSADPYGCQPDPPQQNSSVNCQPGAFGTGLTGGAIVTSAQAVALTQQYMPSALGTSDSENIESLAVAPAVLNPQVPTQPYASNATVLPSAYGGTAPTYTVGSGSAGACNAPQTISPAALPPQVVNGTALEYANTAPSTDTILRPTPLGAQEITQIRDATAPETANYQIALQPGQYLQQLDSGSIAVIDPSIPSISSTLAPDVAIPDGIGGASDTDDTPHGNSEAGPAPTSQDLAGVLPDDDSAILPTQTQFQYENEDQLLQLADQDADGQEVAIISPPWAKDATGTALPVDMAITGPNTYAITTHHRQAGTNYPAMTSRKMTPTKRSRRHFVFKQLDSGTSTGFVASTPKNSDGSTDGVKRIVRMQHLHGARVIINWNACAGFDKTPTDLFANNGANSDGPTPGNPKGGPCYQAASKVNTALQAFGSTNPPIYVTADPIGVDPTKTTPSQYAHEVARLWQSYPFNTAKKWGATNEPEVIAPTYTTIKLQATYAAKVWQRLQALSIHKGANGKQECPKCQIIAGEFVAYSHDYIDQYATFLMKHGSGQMAKPTSKPMYWGFHDYHDITVSGNKYPFAKLVATAVRKFGKDRQIFASEQGVELHNGGGFTSLGQDPGKTDPATQATRQAAAARKLVRLGGADRQIMLTGLYEFFGSSKSDGFDSAVVRPPEGPPITPPDPDPSTNDPEPNPDPNAPGNLLPAPNQSPRNPDGTQSFFYRPSYCVLAKRDNSNCDFSSGR